MKLPRTTGVKVVRALKKAGFEVVGVRGSHRAIRDAIVTVPVHSFRRGARWRLGLLMFPGGV